MYDFDGDGRMDAGEEYLAYKIWEEMTGQNEDEEQLDRLLDELEEALPSVQTVEREWDSREISEEISAWLKSLNAEDRRLFIRRDWYDLPLKDIASEYGIRPQKLAKKMRKLRLSLKQHLEGRGITL